MPQSSSIHGLALAAFGALVLTPDALFMRLSGMDGATMLAWRGCATALVFLTAWAVSRPPAGRAGTARALSSRAGLTVIASQTANAVLFPAGIALAPVAVMLLAVACVPVAAALLSRLLYGERTGRATWAAIAAVLSGIALAVTGKGELGLDAGALAGALCGLGVACSLALTFVTLRHNPGVPILPAMGMGSLAAGMLGLAALGGSGLFDGNVPAILVTGLLIVPVSFFALSSASRHTAAANVSLLMLLETALGPLWVWLGTGEAPTPRMLAGGAVVLGALALYIEHSRRSVRRRARLGATRPAGVDRQDSTETGGP
ncbi:DMT family transporter [Roseivivax sp. CAU 1761]